MREQGRLIKREVTSDIEIANNEESRIDQLKDTMMQMAEQMQALTTALAKVTAAQTMGSGPSARGRDEAENRMGEEAIFIDDDMIDYATARAAESRTELQKLKEHVEKVADKMKSEHEDLLDYEAMVFKEQLPPQFKMPDMTKFSGNGDPRVHLR